MRSIVQSDQLPFRQIVSGDGSFKDLEESDGHCDSKSEQAIRQFSGC